MPLVVIVGRKRLELILETGACLKHFLSDLCYRILTETKVRKTLLIRTVKSSVYAVCWN